MQLPLLLKLVPVAMLIALLVSPSSAVPVSSLPGGTVIPIPAVNYKGTGPQTFGPGITWTAADADSLFGYTNSFGYSFGANGFWDGALGPMAGVNFDGTSMTFAFSAPVRGVGGFVNYYPDLATVFPAYYHGPTTIAVYDEHMNLIESETLTFRIPKPTSGPFPFGINTGEFHGFSETSPTIRYFVLTNNIIGITNLTVDEGSTIPAPEFPSLFIPLTLAICFAGAVLLAKGYRKP